MPNLKKPDSNDIAKQVMQGILEDKTLDALRHSIVELKNFEVSQEGGTAINTISSGSTPLLATITNLKTHNLERREEIFWFLIENGASLDAQGRDLNITPLAVFLYNYYRSNLKIDNGEGLGFVREIIRCNPNALHYKAGGYGTAGGTQLHKTLSSNNFQWSIFLFLVSQGADLNAKNDKNETPLDCLKAQLPWMQEHKKNFLPPELKTISTKKIDEKFVLENAKKFVEAYPENVSRKAYSVS